jgi:hypothetical protein
MTTPRHVTTTPPLTRRERRDIEAQSTQVRHPWRATVRTIVAALIPVIVAAPEVYAAVTGGDPRLATGIAGGVIVAAGVITRVMVIPEVDALLRRIGMGSTPRE